MEKGLNPVVLKAISTELLRRMGAKSYEEAEG